MAKSISSEDHNMVEEKKPICFVIMPISDHPDYDPGHFKRVYNHIFKPAIEQAGYIPIRADDETKSNNIVADIIKKIVESDMAICDISTRNANVLYELGIRHAYDKPVLLVKDEKTESIFDISGIRYTNYDSSLRIDRVDSDIQKIRQSISSHTGDDIESSVMKLSMINYSAKIPKQNTLTGETQIILNTFKSIEDKIKITQQTSRHISTPALIKSIRLGKELFSVGDTIYFPGGREIGKIKYIDKNSGEITIVNKDEQLEIYDFIEIMKDNINTIPF